MIIKELIKAARKITKNGEMASATRSPLRKE